MNTNEDIFSLLRASKLRLTRARKAFIEVLSEASTPLSVPHILEGLKERSIEVNKTTVYRELERFQNLGIVESFQLGDRKQYYELSSREHHHHLVCMSCESVEDIDMDEKLLELGEQKANREKQFTILRHSLEFFGLCRQCQI